MPNYNTYNPLSKDYNSTTYTHINRNDVNNRINSFGKPGQLDRYKEQTPYIQDVTPKEKKMKINANVFNQNLSNLFNAKNINPDIYFNSNVPNVSNTPSSQLNNNFNGIRLPLQRAQVPKEFEKLDQILNDKINERNFNTHINPNSRLNFQFPKLSNLSLEDKQFPEPATNNATPATATDNATPATATNTDIKSAIKNILDFPLQYKKEAKEIPAINEGLQPFAPKSFPTKPAKDNSWQNKTAYQFNRFLENALPFVSNIANAFIKPPLPAAPVYTAPPTYRNIDLSATRNFIERNLNANNQYAAQNFNANIAAALRGNNQAEAIDNYTKVNVEEQNKNNEIYNQNQKLRYDAAFANNNLTNLYNDSLVNREKAIKKDLSENFSNATNKGINLINQNRLRLNDLDTMKRLIASDTSGHTSRWLGDNLSDYDLARLDLDRKALQNTPVSVGQPSLGGDGTKSMLPKNRQTVVSDENGEPVKQINQTTTTGKYGGKLQRLKLGGMLTAGMFVNRKKV